MPDNFVPMFRAPEEKQVKEILAKADVRMEEILKEIRRRGSGEESKAKDLMLSASMQALYRNGRKTARFTRGRHLHRLRAVRVVLSGGSH